jgi:plastocyanin
MLVDILDYGACVSTARNCFFSPANITISVGTTVMWFNRGSMPHTATACTSYAPPSGCPVFNSQSLPSFDSAVLTPNGSYKFTFTTAGTYYYYCTIHPWLHGSVTVLSSPPPPTPISSPFMPTISLAGSINWTAIGLDNNVAVLNFSHRVSIIASAGPVSFTPVTETGSFLQSIDLSTRVESPGTATSVILGIVQRVFGYLGSIGYYGYGYGYSPALGLLLTDQREVYTFWWVNGPLTNGQPVQILTGYSSVMGSEIVTLGPGNNRNAWIVESELSQSVSVNTPPINGPGGSSDASFKLSLRFDYDQASDLLLHSSAVISVKSTQTQAYKPGDTICGASGCFPVSDIVTVTHHMSASVPVTLQLTSTNLDLSKRAAPGATGSRQTSTGSPGGTSGTQTLPSVASLWVYAGIGIAGAAAAVTAGWLLRRRGRMRAPVPQREPLLGASPTLTSP